MKDVSQAAMEAVTVTPASQDDIELSILEQLNIPQDQQQAVALIQDMALKAGRIQAAKLIGTFAESLTVSQLRAMKEAIQGTKITWRKACKFIGISTKTADRYLRLGAALDDDWVAHAVAIGVTVRTLEAARQLPAPVREKLTSGEVVDLERVSKEELTRVIRELAEEHAREQAEAQEALAKEAKAREKAEAKMEETGERLAEAERQARTLAEGLPPDEAEALEVLRRGEREAVMWLVRIKNTVNIAGRDPMFRARLLSSLNLVAELAQATADILGAEAEGGDVDEDYLLSSVHALNRDAAKYDGREPYAGV